MQNIAATQAGAEIHKVENKYKTKTPSISFHSVGSFIQRLFTPFAKISDRQKLVLKTLQVAIVLLTIQLINHPIIPTPIEVVQALIKLIQKPIFIENLISTLGTVIYAMFVSIIVTMLIATLSKLPFFELLAQFASKCRYLTLPSLVFLFTFLTNNVGQLKSSLLIFGIAPYFITSMLAEICLTQQEQDKPFLNKKNAWQALWEVVIVGKLDRTVLVMGMNFAIAWSMISMVEGLAVSEGGIGTMLNQSGKYNSLAPVLALLMVVYTMGILFDVFFATLREKGFPYTNKAK